MMPVWWQALAFKRMTRAASRTRKTLLGIEPLEPRDTPAGILAVGADPGSAPVATVYDADTHAQKFTITAYDSSFTGGVNVAVGDVNGDGTPDVITGAGAGGGPVVNVYSGADGTLLKSFTVGDADSRAGTSVAAADFDHDGAADIVIGTMRNGEPLIQVLRFSDGSVLHGYTPFSGAGGVNVAAGDVNGDGTPDVVAAAGTGGGPEVMAFDGTNDSTLMDVFTFENTFTGGVYVSTGDLNGDGYADVITSAGTGGGPRVQVFSGKTGGVLQNFFAYSDQLRDGARAYAYDVNGDGTPDLVTSEGTGQSNQMKAFDATTLAEMTPPSFAGLPVGVVTSPGADVTAPTVTVTTSATSPTNASTISYTATFSENVTGFTADSVSVTNGTVSNFTATSGTTYTFDVTPTADGDVTVSIAAGAASDSAGNASTASSTVTVTSDRTAPTVTADSLTTNTGTPTLTGTVDDSNATVSVTVDGQTVTATVSGTTWSATVPTALTDGTYDISVTATDAAGNVGTTTATGGLVVDMTVPTPTVSSTAPEPTSTTPIPFTVTFDEDVTGFDASDLTVTNGTVSNFTATGGTTYTFDVTPTADGDVVSVSVAAGAATDAAGNASAASNTLTRTFSTGTIRLTASPLTTNTVTPTLTGTVDDSTATVSVTVDGQTVTATVTGNDWSATLPTVLAEGTYDIQVSATNSVAGSGSLTATGGLVIDLTAPTVESVTTTTSDLTNATVTYTVTFSEPLLTADVDTGDFAATVVSGSFDTAPSVTSVTPVTAGDRSASFTVVVDPGSGEGTIRLDVPDTATVTDPAGNALSVPAGGFVTGDTAQIDTVAPTAEVTSTAPDTTDANPIPFTVSFSEDVTGFTASGVTVSNGTVTNFVETDAKTYTFAVVPAGTGTVSVSVPAGAATDAAGNANTAADALTRTFSGAVTTAAATTTATSPTNAATIPVTVTFSGDVTGFDASDLTVTNGTVSNSAATSGSTYTFDVTPTADGEITVSIPAAAATDGVGNPTAASSTLSLTSDRTAPTATVTASAATSASPITFTVTFSEDVTGFTADSVTATNGTVGTVTQVDARTYTVEVTPAAEGTVTLTVLTGGAQDAAGNAVGAVASGTSTYDTTAPTATVNSDAPDTTETSPIPFTVTFSEAVTGFDGSGVTVTNGTVSNFTATSGTTYTFDVTPTADGDVTVSIAAGVAADAAGNASTAADAVTRTFDGSVTAEATAISDTMPDVNAAEWQTQADGLKIWDVQTGSGTAVTSGSTVQVYYTGWLASDGTQFDSNSTDSTPASFAVSGLIQGWQEGLIGMQPGGIRLLYVPAALAYGDQATGSIPASSDLVFEIKLVSTT